VNGDLATLDLPGPLIRPRHYVAVVDGRAVGGGDHQRRPVRGAGGLSVLDSAGVLSLLLAALHELKIGRGSDAGALIRRQCRCCEPLVQRPITSSWKRRAGQLALSLGQLVRSATTTPAMICPTVPMPASARRWRRVGLLGSVMAASRLSPFPNNTLGTDSARDVGSATGPARSGPASGARSVRLPSYPSVSRRRESFQRFLRILEDEAIFHQSGYRKDATNLIAGREEGELPILSSAVIVSMDEDGEAGRVDELAVA